MTYHEKRALSSIISSILIFCGYFLIVYLMYLNGRFDLTNIFRLWGRIILLLIPISIAAKIFQMIIFTIIHKIATNEDGPSFSDERDKLIELRTTRISLWGFTGGFLLAMAALAVGFPPYWMFVILIGSGFLSDLLSSLFSFIYYRRGF